eukprot:sb/3471121/
MSDLLGSILDNMTKPPNTTNKAELERRKLYRKQEERARRKRKELQGKIELRVDEFVKTSEPEFSFDPAEREIRALQHEVAETAGLISVSCYNGEKSEKHVTVFKKEHCPSDEEIKRRRFGELYIENFGKQRSASQPEDTTASSSTPPPSSGAKKRAVVQDQPHSDYRDKYKKILNTSEIGQDNRDYHGLG